MCMLERKASALYMHVTGSDYASTTTNCTTNIKNYKAEHGLQLGPRLGRVVVGQGIRMSQQESAPASVWAGLALVLRLCRILEQAC